MKCPRCGKEAKRLLALSRADNKTMICDECGTKEALDDAGLTEGSSVRKSILACVGRGSTPQERIRAKVQATGTTYITRFGNTRQKNVFKEFYKTNIGEFTPEKWLEVTLQIIQTLMENELLEEIKEHVAGHCVWLKNDKEIEEYSASCLASGAYMYWEDFKDKRLPAHKVFIFEGGDF